MKIKLDGMIIDIIIMIMIIIIIIIIIILLLLSFRSKLERKELEDEINRMEEEFEHSISILQEEMKTEKDKFDELNEQKDKEHSDAIYNRTVEFESTLNEAKKQSSLIQQEFEGEKEKMVRMLKSIQDELQSEKDRMNIEKCKLEDIIMLKEKQHNEEIIRLSMQLKGKYIYT